MRRALDPAERQLADARIAMRIRQLPAFRAADRVGVYLAFDGEPSLASLTTTAARAGKQVYAPIILPRGALGFAALAADGRLARNRFGISEPDERQVVAPRSLDLILTPLVAFDGRGTRLGVGGGFYDRCFAHLLHRRRWLRPKLLGVGYEFQHVSRLDERLWDVRLWGAVTDRHVYRFDGESR